MVVGRRVGVRVGVAADTAGPVDRSAATAPGRRVGAPGWVGSLGGGVALRSGPAIGEVGGAVAGVVVPVVPLVAVLVPVLVPVRVPVFVPVLVPVLVAGVMALVGPDDEGGRFDQGRAGGCTGDVAKAWSSPIPVRDGKSTSLTPSR